MSTVENPTQYVTGRLMSLGFTLLMPREAVDAKVMGVGISGDIKWDVEL